jgi:glyoxylase-like metal-dependent hydrolase (beta-lactamase superfamily II)
MTTPSTPRPPTALTVPPGHAPARWRIGDVTVTRIEEFVPRLALDYLIPGATPAHAQPLRSGMDPRYLADDGTFVLAICGFVVESDGRRSLVDTCIGCEHPRGSADSPFSQRLADAGFAREDIDIVVCTHMHFDHVGWNTTLVDGTRVPTFPEARYLYVKEEWDAMATAPHDDLLFASVDSQVGWVLEAGIGELVGPTEPLTDEVTLWPTFGHSPGHVSVWIRSGGHEAVITGDAAHHPIQLLDPQLSTRSADADVAEAIKARTRLVEACVDQDVLIVGTHFESPGAGYLRSAGQGLRFDHPGAEAGA